MKQLLISIVLAILCLSIVIALTVYFTAVSIPAYIRIDCYSSCVIEEIKKITHEIDGEMISGIYKDSNKYNLYDPFADVCYFTIKYDDTRMGLWQRTVEKKCSALLNEMYPNVVAMISHGKIVNGFFVDLDDPYGDTDPPWRWDKTGKTQGDGSVVK